LRIRGTHKRIDNWWIMIIKVNGFHSHRFTLIQRTLSGLEIVGLHK
jgi:hypothetical protein